MRNVVVTGATRGLGLAIIQKLLRADYRLICIGRRPTVEFSTLLSAQPARMAFYPFDLEEIGAIPSLVFTITRDHGSIYGLINNAAIGLDGLLATQHASDISRVLRVNLESAIVMTKHACRSMLVKNEGRIINISSIIASTGFSGLSAYAASKAGLEGFTRSLARELGRAKITVNCIAPGFMETDMTAALQGDKLESIRRRAPLGLPQTEDVANATAYILSGDASMITGTVITIDGGSTA